VKLELLLLDRDGVINADSPNYIKSPEEWIALPGALEAIVRLQQHVRVAVCTNQSGVGRGLFDEAILAEIHDKMNSGIESLGGQAVDVFYCPHRPDIGCNCRKPAPGLLLAAMGAYQTNAACTVYVGDSEKDLLAAMQAQCRSVLVLTGNGGATLNAPAAGQADRISRSLATVPDDLGLPL